MRIISAIAIVIFITAGGLLYLHLRPEVIVNNTNTYNPEIIPADFTTDITNRFFSMPVGRKMVYESDTGAGRERVETMVPGWTREMMGVTTLVFWDRVWLNDRLIEDTRDYLAQHKNGDVWYFGEHVDNYENGQIKDHHGAWLAGADGAKPGIWMVVTPQAGDEFRNEYYRGQAEDMTRIVAVDETVATPNRSYNGCVKTFDWSPLFTATANKYFCPEVGGTVLEVDLVGPDNPVEQRTALIEIDIDGASGADLPSSYADEGVEPAPAAGD